MLSNRPAAFKQLPTNIVQQVAVTCGNSRQGSFHGLKAKDHFLFSPFFMIAIQCEEPPKVAGAVMEDGGGFLFKAHVHYTCREGYRMEGTGTLTCEANGKWIGEIPACKGNFFKRSNK